MHRNYLSVILTLLPPIPTNRAACISLL